MQNLLRYTGMICFWLLVTYPEVLILDLNYVLPQWGYIVVYHFLTITVYLKYTFANNH